MNHILIIVKMPPIDEKHGFHPLSVFLITDAKNSADGYYCRVYNYTKSGIKMQGFSSRPTKQK